MFKSAKWDGSNSELPLVTIGIVSCNRLHYLRATLESARRCIQYPNLEWIVVDNASVEKGLRDYLKGLSWIDELILREERSPLTEHVEAMNEIVARAKGELVLIWPEDVQFVVKGDWMVDYAEILMAHPWIGSMNLDYPRRVTAQRLYTWRRWLRWREWIDEFKRHKSAFRRQRIVRSSRGLPVRTFGWVRKEGVIGSGIPSLTRTEVWRELGPWKAPATELNLVDSSGGGETEMITRFVRAGWTLQRAIPILPVAAMLVTDSIGAKAKVVGDKRYGPYAPPPEGTLYYEILNQSDVEHLAHRKPPVPVAFEDIVKPIGYDLPFNDKGGLLKSSINKSVVSPIA